MLGMAASVTVLALPRLWASSQIITPDNTTYGKSLNSVAVLVMGYYGFLLSKTDNRGAYLLTDSLTLSVDDEMRSELTGITINDAELISDADKLIFRVDATLQYQRNQQLYQQDINEDFTFNGDNPTEINAVTRLNDGDVLAIVSQSQLNDLNYYQQRQWIYAWSAYLNGVKTASDWLAQSDLAATNYQLIIGKPRFDGTLADGMLEQQKHLGDGQYLLREVKPLASNDKDRPIIALYFDFKGQKNGTAVIANIEQTIRYQRVSETQFKILSIVEKHLIPNPQPWQKILC